MKHYRCPTHTGGNLARFLLCLSVAACCHEGLRGRATAEEPRGSNGKRTEVGVCTSEPATILRREGADKPWQPVRSKEGIYSGDLLVGLPGAVVDSSDGAVRLHFLADLGELSPYPVKEC